MSASTIDDDRLPIVHLCEGEEHYHVGILDSQLGFNTHDVDVSEVLKAGVLSERQRILGLEVMRDEDIHTRPEGVGRFTSETERVIGKNYLRADLRKAIGDSDEAS